MAQTRLERIGTIFTRITSLMKGGALKPENLPIWYPVYEAFPPKQEPRFDRVAPNIEIQDIFYKEDIIRAKFHKNHKELTSDLTKDYQSITWKFISIYQNLEKDGVPEEDCYKKALEILKESNRNFYKDMEKSPTKKINKGVNIKSLYDK